MVTAPPEPAQIYLQLRERVFTLEPAEVGLAPSNTAPHIWGVLMETGYAVGSATLVCLADGTTSLYFSTGGGMLGSADYTPIAEASKALVAEAENHLSELVETTEFPLPEVGQVRFSCHTYTGMCSAQVPEEALRAGHHPLSPLYKLAHETMEQLRLSAVKKPA